MINNSDDFANAYSTMLANHNYRGLVNLLSTSTFDNTVNRKSINDLIMRFQEQADIEDKLLENADPATQRAYRFITTGPNKADISGDKANPLYNSPSSRFMRGWNSLADADNNINITFENENQYNAFLKSLDADEKVLKTKGINVNSGYNISFPTDIADKIGIYKAIKASGVFEVKNDQPSNRYFYQGFGYSGEPYFNATEQTGKTASGTFSYAEGESGARLREKVVNRVNFADMDAAVTEANEAYAKLFEQKDVKPYLNEMIVTGYMGEDDKQLQKAFSNGLIGLQDFKEMRAILEEKYNRVLQTKSLSQYKVWSMNTDNEGSEVLEVLDDPIAKNELDVEINQAITDGRLHYSHATNGLDIGTMIIIDPKVDKDGKVVEGSVPRRLFVKDLFKSKAENALRDDTQIDAQMQYAKHQTYGHTYRTINGGTITNWDRDNDAGIYTNKNGVAQIVGKADILDTIDNDIIARRMVQYYDDAITVDSNGRGANETFYKLFGSNKPNTTDFYNNIEGKCYAAMAQKYNGQSEEYIAYKANELIKAVLKGLGINFDADLPSLSTLGSIIIIVPISRPLVAWE